MITQVLLNKYIRTEINANYQKGVMQHGVRMAIPEGSLDCVKTSAQSPQETP
jgi:hypothetical protein